MNQAAQQSVRRLLGAASAFDTVSNGLRLLSSRGLLCNGIWKRLPVERRFQVELDGGDSFEYSSIAGDQIGRALFWRGIDGFEAETWRVFYQSCKSARLVLDVGANSGVYTLLACCANPTLRVLTFEPVMRICSRLADNVAINGFTSRCDIFSSAVSDYVGDGVLHVPDGGMPSSASFHVEGFRGVQGTHVTVPVTTLDRAVGPNCHRVDVIKIDVEGFEDDVLRGMSRIFSQSRPTIFMECNPDGPLTAVQGILRKYDYVFHHLLPGGPKRTDCIRPDLRERYRNYLMLPSERAISGIS